VGLILPLDPDLVIYTMRSEGPLASLQEQNEGYWACKVEWREVARVPRAGHNLCESGTGFEPLVDVSQCFFAVRLPTYPMSQTLD
jgi:hypothetical protein